MSDNTKSMADALSVTPGEWLHDHKNGHIIAGEGEELFSICEAHAPLRPGQDEELMHPRELEALMLEANANGCMMAASKALYDVAWGTRSLLQNIISQGLTIPDAEGNCVIQKLSDEAASALAKARGEVTK